MVVKEATRLSGEADCPLCGQGLGAAFEQVQAHRQRELAHAEAELDVLAADEAALAERARAALASTRTAAQRLEHARQVRTAWDEQRATRTAAEARLADLRAGFDPALQPGEESVLVPEVERRRQAAAEAQRLQGRLERAPQAGAELEAQRHDLDVAAGRLGTLRDKVRSLGFSRDDLAVARQSLELAEQAQDQADRSARTAELEAARTAAQAEGAERILAAAQDQHGRLGELTEAARHLGRLADLLSAFRNQLVGAVGPRLSRQAASLFAELTDAEYDELRVDPETYGINIVDQGVAYGMDRFSGSETDLASLALRVAISEHLCFQSGGQIGLLVLDEVFGPLDADRSDRMLHALERLKARFRQVLVVTHDREIKDQLPTAIEVRKLPGRRATAQVIGVS
ncbi:MAG: SbcC/MukB-like Walker B domain-containing protein [Acidimicrobiales bacterium]